MTTKTELTLKLFNAVEAVAPSLNTNVTYTKKCLEVGVYVPETAAYAGKDIYSYFTKNKSDVYKTFHKSWKTIRDSSSYELFVHQILHYCTTYGTDRKSEYIYIPNEYLDIPEVAAKDLKWVYIHTYTQEQLISKCVSLLESGVALDSDTVKEILELLDLCGYEYESVDNFKNKEAVAIIASRTGIVPTNSVELLRVLVYKATDSTLLIKNEETISSIKRSSVDLTKFITNSNIRDCASIFNRFKPIWLAFKTNAANKSIVNRISRLSKKYHKPMPTDVLNSVTSGYVNVEELKKALMVANPFRKMKLLQAMTTRMAAPESYLYRVRNNKSYVKIYSKSELKSKVRSLDIWTTYADTVKASLLKDLGRNIPKGSRIKYPTNMDYALPTSEKMFVGVLPVGTVINTGSTLAAGVYWRNAWGAYDLDLSGIALEKVGWDSVYKSGSVMYSGDLTDASSGATELLYVDDARLSTPTLAINNIYSGNVGCKFNIVVGSASAIDDNNMMTQSAKIVDIPTRMFSKQQIIGCFLPNKVGVDFILLNTSFGNVSASSASSVGDSARAALFSQYAYSVRLRELLQLLEVEFVKEGEECDIDLSYKTLDKTTLINLFA